MEARRFVQLELREKLRDPAFRAERVDEFADYVTHGQPPAMASGS